MSDPNSPGTVYERPRPRRLWLWIGIGLVAYMLLVGALFLFGKSLKVRGFDSIRMGMTQQEVERLLGGPPGNYGSPALYRYMTLEGYLGPPGSTEKIWCNSSNRFEIFFDSNDRVVGFHRRFQYKQSMLPPLWQWF